MRARLISIAMAAAVAAAVAVLAGPLGTRVGAWHGVAGLAVMAIGVLLAAIATVIALAGGWLTGRWVGAVTAATIALVAAVVAVSPVLAARGSPPIHDITTDTGDPPLFVAVLPDRTGEVSPPEYDGPEAATEQRRAYPDIVPLEFAVPAARAFEAAAAVARDLGWDVVAADGASGRIEAIDTTFWFRFKDDVVIRVRETASGSRVDVRSKSRVGRGDIGTNARRIRAFREALSRRIGG